MTRQVYSVLVVSKDGERQEVRYVARRAYDAVRAAKRDAVLSGKQVDWACWNGAKPLSECIEDGQPLRWLH